MRILKLKGKTEEAILNQIQKEYGERAIVLNTQKEERSGLAKWFKAPKIVMTVALKDDDDVLTPTKEEAPIDRDQTMQEASYEVLLKLKEQLNELQHEMGSLKQNQVTTPLSPQSMEPQENNKIIQRMGNKLIQLGIKEELCNAILGQVNCEVPEALIRDVYTHIEELLEEREVERLPQVIFFIGSTGVGKTTTLAKLTAKFVLEEQKKVVLFTSDTYRIAAVEQLKTYADILGVEIEVIYNESELPQYLEKWKHMDHILIDTAGRSHKNEEQVTELKGLMKNVEDKKVFLVLNASTASKDVEKIVYTYEQTQAEFDLILTKLDETDEIGNVVNIAYYAKRPIMYLTNGQNVPADIQTFSREAYITDLLGRISNE